MKLKRLQAILLIILLSIMMMSCSMLSKERQIEYVLITTSDALLEECTRRPPPKVNWASPDEAVKILVTFSVELMHDNQICADRVEAIRKDRDNKILIYAE